MFIVLAIESHHDEEGHVAEEAIDAVARRSRTRAPAGPLSAPTAHPTTVPDDPGSPPGE